MNDSQPKGCLAAILGLFGIQLGSPAPRQALPYRTRDDFLSAAELSFYRVLVLAVKQQAVVLAKVNLADIFFVPKSSESQSYRNKIDRKHVDFLVCEPNAMKPLFGIELDDKSHARPDRVDRDFFVNEVFQAAGLPLARVPVQARYDVQQLITDLAPYLSGRAAPPAKLPPQPQAVPSPVAGQPPTCSKCGSTMLRRTVSKGQNTGKQFWGCANYPRCREVQN